MSNEQDDVNKNSSNKGKKKRPKGVTIKHPNEVTRNFIKWKFTAGENRIMVSMLEKIKANQVSDKHPQVDISNQVALRYRWRDLMLPGSNASDRLVSDLENLREKSISFPTKLNVDGIEKEATTVTGLITEFTYTNSHEEVNIHLSQDWYAFLIDISNGFTMYDKDIAFNLSTSYSIKMYYFCCQWLNIGGKKLSLESFRKEFDIPKEIYTKRPATDFQDRILKPCKKILDSQADVSFNYTTYKEGRRVAGFVFTFYRQSGEITSFIDPDKKDDFFKLLEKFVTVSLEDRARLVGLMREYSVEALKNILMKDINKINEILLQENKRAPDAFAIIAYNRKLPKLSRHDDLLDGKGS